jgi:hypothetical protein
LSRGGGEEKEEEEKVDEELGIAEWFFFPNLPRAESIPFSSPRTLVEKNGSSGLILDVGHKYILKNK